MMKSCSLWSTSVQGMALSQRSSSWRRWMWMEKMPTPYLFIWRKSFHSPAMMPWLSWLIQSPSFGVPSGETTSPGTLRSSLLVLMASPTSATADVFSPLTLRQILKSYLRRSSNVRYNALWVASKFISYDQPGWKSLISKSSVWDFYIMLFHL